jgi:protein-S-isoprenylcysteine O-methyltransferase Ste14
MQTIRWKRLGDVSLCTLYFLLALAPILHTYDAADAGDYLLALHYALSGAATLIVAGLLLIRREAILATTSRREQIIAVVGSFAIIPLGALPLTWQPDWLLEVTSVGFILAYAWIVWALMTLKRSFSIFPEARTLITHGPYGYVRHPLYAAYFVTYTLVMIPRLSALAVAVAVIGIAAEVNRSRNEERLLRRAFDDYDEYARHVRAFVPIRRRGG